MRRAIEHNEGAAESGLSKRTLTVTMGAEKFSPIQYHTIDLGPISATVAVPDDMSFESAHRAVLSELRLLQTHQFEVQLADFSERVRKAATVVRSAK